MLIQNALVYTEAHRFCPGSLLIRDGRIVPPAPLLEGEPVLDAHGAYALPGLVDLHLHGALGCDVSDADSAGLRTLTEYEAQQGVLAVCPAAMTLPEERLSAVMDTVAAHENRSGADVLGVRMEGPYLNPACAGAQDAQWMRPADGAEFARLQARSGGRIRIVDLAPEVPGNLAFLRAHAGEVRVSLAHTAADYDTALAAFSAGARQLTHLFNAMPGIHHRAPGPILAALEAGASVELIADGVHVHPAAVRFVFRVFGADRVLLISDSMRACGLPDGDYTLGGQAVTVRGERAVLTHAPETLAGSVTNLWDCMRRAVSFGVPLEAAVQAAAENPARALGAEEYGRLAPGCWGNVVLADETLRVRTVLRHGTVLRQDETTR